MSDYIAEGRRLSISLPRDSTIAPRMIADALLATEIAERERIRKLALEPSEEMVERMARALATAAHRHVLGGSRWKLWIPDARAAFRAFAEEIGR